MDDVRQKVRDYIFQQMFTETLLSERNVAQKFNLKRNSVREIFLGLEGDGILERLPQRGYRFVNYSNVDRDSVYTVRYAVEHEALRCAVLHAKDEDIEELRKCIEEMQRRVDAHENLAFSECDTKFHRLVVLFSYNNFLIQIFQFMTFSVFRICKNPDDRVASAMECHKEMFDAIAARNWPAAEAALRKHLNFKEI